MPDATWSPSWCPHVVGTYSAREYDEDGNPEPQDVRVVCKRCGATWPTTCTSGAVRTLISRFAARHVHKDKLEAERVVRPGSLRRGGES